MAINNLNVLDEKTLILMADRIIQIQRALQLDVQLTDSVAWGAELQQASSVELPFDLGLAMDVANSYAAILYRSLFQNAEWVLGQAWQYIELEAFLDTQAVSWKANHEKISEYVNESIAHQDTSSKDRYVYPRLPTGQYVARRSAPNLLGMNLIDTTQKMLEKVKEVFRQKAGHELEFLR